MPELESAIRTEKTEITRLLRRARQLISRPDRWTRKTMARNPRTGRAVGTYSRLAGQWCALGALHRFHPEEALICDAVSELRKGGVPDDHSLGSFNDSHTHQEVLDLFDSAIRRLDLAENP